MIVSIIVSILAPVFISVGIGFGWAKSGKSYDTDLITSIVTYFGAPCLLFYSLSAIELHPQALFNMGLAAIYANAAFIIIGALFLAIFRLPQRAFLQTLSFPNVANVGLPLCYLAFGKEGLALGVTFFAIYAVFQMTIGAAFVSGSFSPKILFKMPIIPATILAAFFLFTGIQVPEWLYNTTKLIGDLTIPLMLFTLGVTLSHLKVRQFKIPVLLSFLRLGMGFGVGVALVALMNLSGPAAGVVILECSMPAAIFCYLFAQKYDQHPEEVAGVVIVSTLLGFLFLPVLLWYVLG
jgi:predicted permease